LVLFVDCFALYLFVVFCCFIYLFKEEQNTHLEMEDKMLAIWEDEQNKLNNLQKI
jgi:hypothetical protein